MFNGTFFTTHTTHLIEEHIEESVFWGSVFIGGVVTFDHRTVNNKAMLIKDRLKGINDTFFLPDIGSYLFYVNSLFGLLQVFIKELTDNTITEVSLDEKLSNVELLTASKDV